MKLDKALESITGNETDEQLEALAEQVVSYMERNLELSMKEEQWAELEEMAKLSDLTLEQYCGEILVNSLN